MDMDMGMNGMPGMPSFEYMQRTFWTVIGVIIAVATLSNVLNVTLLWHRRRTLKAKPESIFWISYATLTALTREISNASFHSLDIGRFKVRPPQLGRVLLVLSYFALVLTLCLYGYDLGDQWSWENIAYRCGCIAQAQLPLIFLLAGKRNLIGSLTGTSYERLSWLHRWVARILWITTTIHMSYWYRSWARYDWIMVELTTNNMAQTGFAAWCILTMIVIISAGPVRRLNYEIFFISHIVLFAGFIGALMLHFMDHKIYIWIPVGLYFFDRLLRFGWTLFANLSIFHRTRAGKSGMLANKATFTTLPGNMTLVSIDKPVVSWRPGQHAFVSCHSLAPVQSHPFTIASLPTDEKMEFIIQAQKGGTRRFHRHASRHSHLPTSQVVVQGVTTSVLIDGPYGRLRPLEQFDSVVFVAGGVGATFTTPLMRDLVRQWKSEARTATKSIKFVWVVRARSHISWFRTQLEQAVKDVEALATVGGREKRLDISLYVTCDDDLTVINSDSGETPSNTETKLADERKKAPLTVVTEVQAGGEQTTTSCGPNGTCCCRNEVDEEGITPVNCCCCNPSSSSSDISSSNGSLKEKADLTLSPITNSSLKVFAGRPQCRTLIRKVLEEAEGESAVIACGPAGLRDDIRQTVVSLSDERAVHKGTGAQGIYLHIEGFSY